MAADEAPAPMRLMNFVSEDQLEESRKIRGARVEDGTAQRDRSLYEILQENKDKKDAEFSERFKHRPPKALDEDETEFLDKLEMTKREHERQLADEEEKQLRSFQAAVEAQSTTIHEIKEEPSIPRIQEMDKKPAVGKRNPPPRPVGMIIKVKPQAKKTKVNPSGSEETPIKTAIDDTKKIDTKLPVTRNSGITVSSGLVSYSDESEEDDS